MKEKRKLRVGRPTVHGGFSYLATGRVPEHRVEIKRFLRDIRDGLIADVAGSEDNLTAAQDVLIGRVISKLGVLRCMEAHIAETKEIIKGGELNPLLGQFYLAYSNSVRLDLVALGVARKADGGGGVDLSKFIRAEKR